MNLMATVICGPFAATGKPEPLKRIGAKVCRRSVRVCGGGGMPDRHAVPAGAHCW